jgi:hypothetical protein
LSAAPLVSFARGTALAVLCGGLLAAGASGCGGNIWFTESTSNVNIVERIVP